MKRTNAKHDNGFEKYFFLHDSPRERIIDIVRELNPTTVKTFRGKDLGEVHPRVLPLSDMQEELRALVAAWMASGPNLRKQFKQDPTLAERTRHGKTVLYPLEDGYGHSEWTPVTPESHRSTANGAFASPKDQALSQFMLLITNPLWASLGGPCHRCGSYFMKATNRKRVYCSKTCSSTTTAVSAVKKKRLGQKVEKVAQARAAIAEYQTKKRYTGWKKWVQFETGLTVRWLSRAVNSGELLEPMS